jgi:ankyrin repeat protein
MYGFTQCVLHCVCPAVPLQKSKYRALHLAAMSGSAAVVAVLLEAGAWVDARSQVSRATKQHSQHMLQLV